jgi:UrcA family protein
MSRILRGSAVSAVAALGLSFTAAQAQPYYDDYSDTYAPAPDDTYAPAPDAYAYDTAPGITVYAHPYRQPRASNGAPIVHMTASRVVPIDDLDLGTGYGRYVMRQRVERAAVDACRDLDTTPGYVPDVGESDVDCQRRAVADAYAAAPVVRDSDYYGY